MKSRLIGVVAGTAALLLHPGTGTTDTLGQYWTPRVADDRQIDAAIGRLAPYQLPQFQRFNRWRQLRMSGSHEAGSWEAQPARARIQRINLRLDSRLGEYSRLLLQHHLAGT